MNFKQILFVGLFIFLLNSQIVKADDGCFMVKDNLCPETTPILSDTRMCQDTVVNSICCCPEKGISTKPKYLLIGSVVTFFAILTGLVLFYKKNEY